MWTAITGVFKGVVGWFTGHATRIWLYLGIAGVAVGVLLTAWLKARSDGANAERLKQAQQGQKNLQERRNVEDNVRSLGDGTVNDKLRQWQRD